MSAATVTTHTVAGVTFRSCQRTADHLAWTVQRLAEQHPSARMRVVQTCYHVGVDASSGTHNLDSAFDVEFIGLGWWEGQRFLRSCGWAAWYRHLGTWKNESAWHDHMISLPPMTTNRPTLTQIKAAFSAAGIRVGEFIPGQVDDYFAHALGLAGQHRAGSDTSWHPADIVRTIFDHKTYLERKAAAAATYLDVTVALARLAGDSKNPDAVPIYLKARAIVGKLVSDGRRVSVPRTTAEVIAVLEAKRAASSNYWTKYRLGRVIKMLRPLA